ncbi:hypothetical protein BC835DRAFT_1312932 [Cytidiella melzeri]|nr:hypothetical protein BC835DRAFT_1312932 [Cytidiella melzeri]
MCCIPARSPEIDEEEIALASWQKGKEKESHARSCCHPSPRTTPPPKRRRHVSRLKSPSFDGNGQNGPSLPPILRVPPTSAPLPAVPLPEFPTIPSLGVIASLAGTGCTCGLDCTCPGCIQHRGPEHAEPSSEDCPDCSSCVDHRLTMELPQSTTFGANVVELPTPSFVDAFFARAAALPPPPVQRASTINLDPTNITVYPTSLFDGEANKLDERGPSFGLVRLPKLECCAGRCGCPGDSCGCGTNCGGCCGGEKELESKVDGEENEGGKTVAASPAMDLD